MSRIFTRYREIVRHQHGWEVELRCSGCATAGVPRYEGWAPMTQMRFRDRPTIFANLRCAKCGREMKEEAERKLVDLFRGISIPDSNRRLLRWFLAGTLGIPIILAALIYVGVLIGVWDSKAFIGVVFGAFLTQPVAMYFNYKVAGLRSQCECGKPAYLFMGLLGRAYCYRCSSCGRLLKLRD